MPFISGNGRSGWAVVRGAPGHVARVYQTEQEANAKAAQMGDGYEVKYGRVSGDSDVDEAL